MRKISSQFLKENIKNNDFKYFEVEYNSTTGLNITEECGQFSLQFEKIDTEIIVDWSSKYVEGTLTTFQGLEEKGIIEGEISIDSFKVKEIFTQLSTNMIPQKDLELEDLLSRINQYKILVHMKKYSEIIRILENQIEIIETIVSLKKEVECHLNYSEDFKDLFPNLAYKGIERIKEIEKEIAKLEQQFKESSIIL